jgi:lysophospholipase L1-like esterase
MVAFLVFVYAFPIDFDRSVAVPVPPSVDSLLRWRPQKGAADYAMKGARVYVDGKPVVVQMETSTSLLVRDEESRDEFWVHRNAARLSTVDSGGRSGWPVERFVDPLAPPTVIAVGDSITWGRNCDGEPSTTSYPAQLEDLVRSHGGEDTRVYDAAAFGMSVRWALDTLDNTTTATADQVINCGHGMGNCGPSGKLGFLAMVSEALRTPPLPDMMLLMFGSNDVDKNTIPEIFPWVEYYDEYERVIRLLRRDFIGGPIVLITPPRTYDQRGYLVNHWRLRRLHQALALNEGIHYLDLHDHMLKAHTCDGVHFVPAGNAALARAIYRGLRSLGLLKARQALPPARDSPASSTFSPMWR